MRLGLSMPLRRSAVWTMRHFLGLRTNFNSQIGLGFVCPVRRNGLATFSPQVCFYEAAFLCGLRLTVHPFIMELLDDFGIALGQLMSCFLGRGGLGLSGICLRHSNIGSPGSFLYSGMNLRPFRMRFGVISQGCTTGGEPQT